MIVTWFRNECRIVENPVPLLSSVNSSVNSSVPGHVPRDATWDVYTTIWRRHRIPYKSNAAPRVLLMLVLVTRTNIGISLKNRHFQEDFYDRSVVLIRVTASALRIDALILQYERIQFKSISFLISSISLFLTTMC